MRICYARLLASFLFCILILSSVAAACVLLQDGTTYNETIYDLCTKNYTLAKGIRLAGVKTIIDCHGSLINASNASVTGVAILGQSGELRNCTLSGFGIAVQIKGKAVAKLRYSTIRDSIVGIHGADKRHYVPTNDTKFANNTRNRANASFDVASLLHSAAVIPAPSSDKMIEEKQFIHVAGKAAILEGMPRDVERMLIYIKGFVIAVVMFGFAIFVLWEFKRGMKVLTGKFKRRRR